MRLRQYIQRQNLLVLVSASVFADPAYKFYCDYVSVADADGIHWDCVDTDYAIVYNNFLCGDESRFTVTPAGRVNFQCRVIED